MIKISFSSIRKGIENFVKKREKTTKIFVGIITGLINGLFGGGGGMVVVPTLEKLFGIKTKNAHATAILIILPITVISGIFYVFFNGIDWAELSFVSMGVMIGGVIGSVFLKKLNSVIISVVFALLMLISGIKMAVF